MEGGNGFVPIGHFYVALRLSIFGHLNHK